MNPAGTTCQSEEPHLTIRSDKTKPNRREKNKNNDNLYYSEIEQNVKILGQTDRQRKKKRPRETETEAKTGRKRDKQTDRGRNRKKKRNRDKQTETKRT